MLFRFVDIHVIWLFILLYFLSSSVKGQTNTLPSLQHIAFKDKVLERNLNDYANRTGDKFINVSIEWRDSGYVCNLWRISFYEDIEVHSDCAWGQWRNRILLFGRNKTPHLREVITISDTCNFSHLLLYVRPLLPKEVSTYEENNDCVIILVHGTEWTFEVQNGREVWLRTTDGYDSRDIIQPN